MQSINSLFFQSKEIKILTLVILFTFALSSPLSAFEEVKKSFSLQNSSLTEAIKILENKYDYKIDYKGKNTDKRLTIEITDATLNGSLKKIFSDFGINNWTNYKDIQNKNMSIRTLSSDKIAKNEHSRNINSSKPQENKEESNFTQEDLYFLRENSEKEKQKQQLEDKNLTYEEMEFLEKNKINDNKIQSEITTLTSEEIEKLSKNSKLSDADETLSPSELELLKKESRKLQNEIEMPLSPQELQMLQRTK